MIVTQTTFQDVVESLRSSSRLGLDTESTGLRMYHDAEICSIILADENESYYFNFHEKWDHNGQVPPSHFVLPRSWLTVLQERIFDDPNKTYYIQRAANFDMPMLGKWGLELRGDVHCTLVVGRVVYNDRMGFSLEDQLPEIGLAKDKTVEDYIEAHKLFTLEAIPGKAQRFKNRHYSKVPFNILAPYGESDGSNVLALGLFQEKKIASLDAAFPELTASGRSLQAVVDNEKRLVKTVYRMKNHGVQIDTEYCKRAIIYETDRAEKAASTFKLETGLVYSASPKVFAKAFADQKDKWSYTPKGNPSFDADALTKFTGPIAETIFTLRDAKSKSDFYQGFLYHADSRGVVHPNFNSEGAIHGRFSSSEPNFQNLTKEDDEEQIAGEFIIRRAIIPRPGFFLIMPDFEQMEYKFALEQACRLAGHVTPLGQMIIDGFDFHDATGKRVFDTVAREFPRKIIKNANFLTLYGGGAGKMAETLGIPIREARVIRAAIKMAAPEIDDYIQTIMKIAAERTFIVNWLGRRSHFFHKHMCYKAPNYHISGGCADVVKVAMNRIDEYLLDKKSKMVMTVHDELPIEVHESEAEEVPSRVQEIMQSVYQHKYIPLTTSMEHSFKSLGDKVKGYPK